MRAAKSWSSRIAAWRLLYFRQAARPAGREQTELVGARLGGRSKGWPAQAGAVIAAVWTNTLRRRRHAKECVAQTGHPKATCRAQPEIYCVSAHRWPQLMVVCEFQIYLSRRIPRSVRSRIRRRGYLWSGRKLRTQPEKRWPRRRAEGDDAAGAWCVCSRRCGVSCSCAHDEQCAAASHCRDCMHCADILDIIFALNRREIGLSLKVNEQRRGQIWIEFLMKWFYSAELRSKLHVLDLN